MNTINLHMYEVTGKGFLNINSLNDVITFRYRLESVYAVEQSRERKKNTSGF